MSGLRKDLTDLASFWAVGGNGISAEAQDIISACGSVLADLLERYPAGGGPGGELAPEPLADYRRRVRALFAPIDAEVERLREALDDAMDFDDGSGPRGQLHEHDWDDAVSEATR